MAIVDALRLLDVIEDCIRDDEFQKTFVIQLIRETRVEMVDEISSKENLNSLCEAVKDLSRKTDDDLDCPCTDDGSCPCLDEVEDLEDPFDDEEEEEDTEEEENGEEDKEEVSKEGKGEDRYYWSYKELLESCQSFSELIDAVAETYSVSNVEFGKVLDLSSATISNYRHGRYTPTKNAVDKIATALKKEYGVPVRITKKLLSR